MASELTDVGTALRSSLGGSRRVALGLGVVLALFLLAPIVIILLTAVTTSSFLELPSSGLSLKWFHEVFTDPTWTGPFWLSLRLSALAALLATIMGTLAALAMQRIRRFSSALRAVLIAPLILPHVVYALGLYNVIDAFRVPFTSTWPIVVGQTTLAFPLVLVTVMGGLAALDTSHTRAAASLGARWTTIVWRIEIPQVRRTIVAGALFAFAFCFDELVIALFLSGPETMTLPVQIYTAAQEEVSPAVAAASAVVMSAALTTGACVALLARGGRSRTRTTADAAAVNLEEGKVRLA